MLCGLVKSKHPLQSSEHPYVPFFSVYYYYLDYFFKEQIYEATHLEHLCDAFTSTNKDMSDILGDGLW